MSSRRLGSASWQGGKQYRDTASMGYIPYRETITAGIFGEQYFDVIPAHPMTNPVEATLQFAESVNPFTGVTEHFLLVGLTGEGDGKNEREKTDVVIVIDRSGSMGSALTELEGAARMVEGARPSPSRTKMALTIEATKAIFDLVADDEMLGIVAFDDRVEVVGLLKAKGEVDRTELFEHLDLIKARGGTNMEIGMEAAIAMLKEDPHAERNKRIIFVTDDQPNIGRGAGGLREMAEAAFVESKGTLGVTYIGVGLSFNAAVSAELCKVRGTSVTTANSSSQLRKTLVEDFNYMVSPVAVDVEVSVNCPGFRIQAVYGCDEDAARPERMSLKFRTLTASALSPEGVQGGVILVKMEKTEAPADGAGTARVTIDFTPWKSEAREGLVSETPLVLSGSLATRKAIALSRYYDVMRETLPAEGDYRARLSDADKAKVTALKTYLSGEEDVHRDLAPLIDALSKLLLIK
jgi:hypothetical protein